LFRRLVLAAALVSGLGACAHAPTSAGSPRTVVFFTADSAGLDDSALATIRQAAEVARSNPSLPVRVMGFAAPDTGSVAYNKVLAQARAQNVADALIAAGVSRMQLRLESRGATSFEMMPTESRRVDIVIGT
jgi:outer membrane protein OmpA-like peptidoglycan-associated protein